jgi:hypothetical protein
VDTVWLHLLQRFDELGTLFFHSCIFRPSLIDCICTFALLPLIRHPLVLLKCMMDRSMSLHPGFCKLEAPCPQTVDPRVIFYLNRIWAQTHHHQKRAMLWCISCNFVITHPSLFTSQQE